VTALLCGPAALEQRVGGRIGLWWATLANRLHTSSEPGPARIPIQLVSAADARRIRLRVPTGEVPGGEARAWARDKVVRRIPGHQR
jgi:hypothetical protein